MITGLLRVKNEGRWIARCIASIRPLCDRILVLDDHSTDDTVQICSDLGVRVYPSPFHGLDEARDKNWLLDQARGSDWVVMIDGDEELAPGGAAILSAEMAVRSRRCISLDVLYLWDKEDQVRTDGVYREFLRQSIFRPGTAKYTSGPAPNFHCGNVPLSIRFPYYRSKAKLLHYGYLNQSDRLRKYEWYNQADPNNESEDRYRHMVVGDAFPATAKFRHGGPLLLKPLSEVMGTAPKG
jgi:glycosyltransferase involved in cell wall biosynthesis